ncbi:MAG: penicillin-binding protein 2, partial [Desulfosalsimonas sp.]
MQSANTTSEGRLQNYLQSIDTDWYRSRFVVLVVAVVAAFTLLAGKLAYLQIYKGSQFYELSKDNCIRKKRSKAFRGLIYDRDGRLLVENRPAFNVQVVRRDAEPLEETLSRLAVYLPLTKEEIREKLRAHNGGPYDPVLIREDIDRNTMAAIAANRFQLPGVSIEARARRHYIYPTLAPHLLGYMGEVSAEEIRENKYPDKAHDDYVGRLGVEKAFEQELSGKAGGRVVQVNAAGQVVSVLEEVAPQPGNHLFLTLDFSLQETAEALLGDKNGAVVAMDPGNGDVLAMVSKPCFNPNQFVDGMSSKQWQQLIGNLDQPMINKAIQAEYPPASTYKIVTALAALEEEAVSLSERINCPGYLRYGNRLYYCWKRWGHGKMDVVDALAQSCDVYFYQMGKRLGVDTLAAYTKACGLGEPTGIALDREADGLVPTAEWKKRHIGERWQGGETLSMAIGQSFN